MRKRIENPMFRRVFLAFFAVVALGLPQASAQRYARDPYGSQVVPLERVLPQIRRGYPGTFYDAEGPYPDEMGNPHYHIKWLTPEGRVIWLDTDARTGRVLGVNGSGWHTQQQFHGAPRYNGPVVGYPPPGRYPPGPAGWNRGNPPSNWNRGNFHGGYPAGGNRWGGHSGHRGY